MKKIFLSVLLFVMLISMNYEKSNATCPSGYTEYSQTVTINGCDFFVRFCFKCPVSSNTGIEIIINQFSIPNSTCYTYFVNNSQSVIESIKNQLISDMAFTGCGSILPCNQGSKPVYVYVPICWQTFHFHDSNEDYYELRVCNDVVLCKSTYSICYDYSTSPPTKVTTFVGKTIVGGTPPCDAGIPSNWLPDWNAFSDCWQLDPCTN